MSIPNLLEYISKGQEFKTKVLSLSNTNYITFNDAESMFDKDSLDDDIFPLTAFMFILRILHDPNKAKELKYNWSANGYGFLFLENFGYLIKNELFIGILCDVLEKRKKISNYASQIEINEILVRNDPFSKSIESFLVSPLDYKKKILAGLPIWYVGLAIKKFYEITQTIEDYIYKSQVINSIDKNTMYRLSDIIFKKQFGLFGITKFFYKAGSTLNDEEKSKI